MRVVFRFVFYSLSLFFPTARPPAVCLWNEQKNIRLSLTYSVVRRRGVRASVRVRRRRGVFLFLKNRFQDSRYLPIGRYRFFWRTNRRDECASPRHRPSLNPGLLQEEKTAVEKTNQKPRERRRPPALQQVSGEINSYVRFFFFIAIQLARLVCGAS